jgi:hypothetical protein
MTDEIAKSPSFSFAQYLEALQAADEALTLPIDPAQLVGDLRDKVDSIKYVIDRFEAFAEFMKVRIAPLMKARQSAENNRDRLRSYLAINMTQHNFQEVPGREYRIALQESQPSLEVTRQPTAADYLAAPELVELVKSYRWKNDVIKDALMAGDTYEFARLNKGKHVKFYPARAVDKPAKKKKGVIDVESTSKET